VPTDLRALVAPEHTVLLTQECQRGVIGEGSAWPALTEAARTSGMTRNVGRLVREGRAAGVQILHAIAARREDGKAISRNARLFRAAERSPVKLTVGTWATELAEGIDGDPSDLVSTRLFGLSPITGTEVDALLRNVGCRTLVVVGVSSNVAVPATVLEAAGLGYETVVVRDAITGTPPEYTDVIIENTLSLVATIVTTDQLLDAWGRSAG
jgi:nicotinamidase-related amidase